MSILVDERTRLLVQGMGREGTFHAEQAIDYGTRYVGGVAPGRGSGAALGRPLFDTRPVQSQRRGRIRQLFSSRRPLRLMRCSRL